MDSSEEHDRLVKAQQYIALHREVYEEYRARWQEARIAWQQLTTMRIADRPPDYPARLARAKMAVDTALKDWTILGKKAQYEQAEAVTADLMSRSDMDSTEEEQT